MTSNFIGDALEHCRTLGFCGALLVGHIGKLVKLAGGMWNTHSKFGDCRMELLAAHAASLGLRPEKVSELLACVMCGEMEIGAMVFSKEYGRLCQTSCAQALLQKIMEA